MDPCHIEYEIFRARTTCLSANRQKDYLNDLFEENLKLNTFYSMLRSTKPKCYCDYAKKRQKLYNNGENGIKMRKRKELLLLQLMCASLGTIKTKLNNNEDSKDEAKVRDRVLKECLCTAIDLLLKFKDKDEKSKCQPEKPQLESHCNKRSDAYFAKSCFERYARLAVRRCEEELACKNKLETQKRRKIKSQLRESMAIKECYKSCEQNLCSDNEKESKLRKDKRSESFCSLQCRNQSEKGSRFSSLSSKESVCKSSRSSSRSSSSSSKSKSKTKSSKRDKSRRSQSKESMCKSEKGSSKQKKLNRSSSRSSNSSNGSLCKSKKGGKKRSDKSKQSNSSSSKEYSSRKSQACKQPKRSESKKETCKQSKRSESLKSKEPSRKSRKDLDKSCEPSKSDKSKQSGTGCWGRKNSKCSGSSSSVESKRKSRKNFRENKQNCKPSNRSGSARNISQKNEACKQPKRSESKKETCKQSKRSESLNSKGPSRKSRKDVEKDQDCKSAKRDKSKQPGTGCCGRKKSKLSGSSSSVESKRKSRKDSHQNKKACEPPKRSESAKKYPTSQKSEACKQPKRLESKKETCKPSKRSESSNSKEPSRKSRKYSDESCKKTKPDKSKQSGTGCFGRKKSKCSGSSSSVDTKHKSRKDSHKNYKQDCEPSKRSESARKYPTSQKNEAYNKQPQKSKIEICKQSERPESINSKKPSRKSRKDSDESCKPSKRDKSKQSRSGCLPWRRKKSNCSESSCSDEYKPKYKKHVIPPKNENCKQGSLKPTESQRNSRRDSCSQEYQVCKGSKQSKNSKSKARSPTPWRCSEPKCSCSLSSLESKCSQCSSREEEFQSTQSRSTRMECAQGSQVPRACECANSARAVSSGSEDSRQDNCCTTQNKTMPVCEKIQSKPLKRSSLQKEESCQNPKRTCFNESQCSCSSSSVRSKCQPITVKCAQNKPVPQPSNCGKSAMSVSCGSKDTKQGTFCERQKDTKANCEKVQPIPSKQCSSYVDSSRSVGSKCMSSHCPSKEEELQTCQPSSVKRSQKEQDTQPSNCAKSTKSMSSDSKIIIQGNPCKRQTDTKANCVQPKPSERCSSNSGSSSSAGLKRTPNQSTSKDRKPKKQKKEATQPSNSGKSARSVSSGSKDTKQGNAKANLKKVKLQPSQRRSSNSSFSSPSRFKRRPNRYSSRKEKPQTSQSSSVKNSQEFKVTQPSNCSKSARTELSASKDKKRGNYYERQNETKPNLEKVRSQSCDFSFQNPKKENFHKNQCLCSSSLVGPERNPRQTKSECQQQKPLDEQSCCCVIELSKCELKEEKPQTGQINSVKNSHKNKASQPSNWDKSARTVSSGSKPARPSDCERQNETKANSEMVQLKPSERCSLQREQSYQNPKQTFSFKNQNSGCSNSVGFQRRQSPNSSKEVKSKTWQLSSVKCSHKAQTIQPSNCDESARTTSSGSKDTKRGDCERQKVKSEQNEHCALYSGFSSSTGSKNNPNDGFSMEQKPQNCQSSSAKGSQKNEANKFKCINPTRPVSSDSEDSNHIEWGRSQNKTKADYEKVQPKPCERCPVQQSCQSVKPMYLNENQWEQLLCKGSELSVHCSMTQLEECDKSSQTESICGQERHLSGADHIICEIKSSMWPLPEYLDPTLRRRKFQNRKRFQNLNLESLKVSLGKLGKGFNRKSSSSSMSSSSTLSRTLNAHAKGYSKLLPEKYQTVFQSSETEEDEPHKLGKYRNKLGKNEHTDLRQNSNKAAEVKSLFERNFNKAAADRSLSDPEKIYSIERGNRPPMSVLRRFRECYKFNVAPPSNLECGLDYLKDGQTKNSSKSCEMKNSRPCSSNSKSQHISPPSFLTCNNPENFYRPQERVERDGNCSDENVVPHCLSYQRQCGGGIKPDQCKEEKKSSSKMCCIAKTSNESNLKSKSSSYKEKDNQTSNSSCNNSDSSQNICSCSTVDNTSSKQKCCVPKIRSGILSDISLTSVFRNMLVVLRPDLMRKKNSCKQKRKKEPCQTLATQTSVTQFGARAPARTIENLRMCCYIHKLKSLQRELEKLRIERDIKNDRFQRYCAKEMETKKQECEQERSSSPPKVKKAKRKRQLGGSMTKSAGSKKNLEGIEKKSPSCVQSPNYLSPDRWCELKKKLKTPKCPKPLPDQFLTNTNLSEDPEILRCRANKRQEQLEKWREERRSKEAKLQNEVLPQICYICKPVEPDNPISSMDNPQGCCLYECTYCQCGFENLKAEKFQSKAKKFTVNSSIGESTFSKNAKEEKKCNEKCDEKYNEQINEDSYNESFSELSACHCTCPACQELITKICADSVRNNSRISSPTKESPENMLDTQGSKCSLCGVDCCPFSQIERLFNICQSNNRSENSKECLSPTKGNNKPGCSTKCNCDDQEKGDLLTVLPVETDELSQLLPMENCREVGGSNLKKKKKTHRKHGKTRHFSEECSVKDKEPFILKVKYSGGPEHSKKKQKFSNHNSNCEKFMIDGYRYPTRNSKNNSPIILKVKPTASCEPEEPVLPRTFKKRKNEVYSVFKWEDSPFLSKNYSMKVTDSNYATFMQQQCNRIKIEKAKENAKTDLKEIRKEKAKARI